MNYKFLLHISHAYGIPICSPLEQEIIRRGHEVKWFSEVNESISLLQGRDNVLTKPEDVMAYGPNIVLSAANDVPDFFPGIKIQIFHGFSINKRSQDKGHFRIRGFFDLYCTQGPSTTKLFQELANEHGFFEAVETGWSKMDTLFPISAPDIHAKPRILISSTFTKNLSLAHDDAFFEEIRRLTLEDRYQWMIVMHPLMDKARVAAFKSLQNDHVKFFDTTDLIPLFKQCDIMISDTSSAVAEFLLQQKPVITYKNNSPGNYLLDIRSPQELAAAIDLALSRPDDLLARIGEYIQNIHPYSDGKSSQRVIDSALHFLRKDKSHLKKKPLNLFRKLQIRKKYGFYTLKSETTPITMT
ncbi:MAG: CDP-glycerol glycerophosphotransferase family protein [Arenimonas sp.]